MATTLSRGTAAPANWMDRGIFQYRKHD